MESVRVVAQSGGEIWNTLLVEFADQESRARRAADAACVACMGSVTLKSISVRVL
ncbi:MAG: hypothetical protein R3F17_05475 [Planctomycetota bacterium]